MSEKVYNINKISGGISMRRCLGLISALLMLLSLYVPAWAENDEHGGVDFEHRIEN